MVGGVLLVGQVIILPTGTNIACTAATIASAALTFWYCSHGQRFQLFPLSMVAVVGYNLSTHSLALVAQTLGGRPLTFNLQWPERTFMLSIVLGLVLIAAHATYAHSRLLQSPARLLAQRILMPIGLFRLPRQAELWVLGFVGLASIWVTRVIYKTEIEFGNVGGKLLDGLGPYQVAPAFILIRGLWANRPVRNETFTNIALVGYFGLVLVTAAALNSRGAFTVVLFDVLSAFALMLALGRIKLTAKLRGRVVLIALLGLPLMSVAQDFSSAMLSVRDQRANLSTSELLRATIDAFGNQQELAASSANPTLSRAKYSEDYIANPFLQRLTYVKYTDIQINASMRFSERQIDLVRQDFWDRLAATLPTPILTKLHINVNKNDRVYSLGDFYDSIAFGTAPGGFKTGSAIVNSLDILGPWWLPTMFVVYIAIFVTLEMLVLRLRTGTVLSPLAFLLMFHIAFASTVGDSLAIVLDGLGRGLLQPLATYLMLIFFARFLLLPFSAPPVLHGQLRRPSMGRAYRSYLAGTSDKTR